MRLTKEQKQFYKDNGFIKLSGIFTDKEMDIVSEEYNRLFQLKNKNNLEAAWQGPEMKKAAQNQEYTVNSIHNLQYHSSVFSNLLSNSNLLDALEDVMETPDILLHHTKAHFKPARKGAPFVMHQDYQYFPFKNDSMVAVFLHIDKSDPENGGLCIYPGSHKLGPLEDHGVKTEVQEYHYADQKKFPIEKATPVHAERGDVVIFSYLLLHGSYRNLSERPRRMFLAQLMAADDEPLVDTHKSYGQGWVLRGRNDYRTADISERHLH